MGFRLGFRKRVFLMQFGRLQRRRRQLRRRRGERELVMRSFLLLAVLAAPGWCAKPFPASPRDYVHNEGVISASAESELSSLLSGVEKQSGHQFVVALFQSMEGESLEDYTNRLFKHWRIGDAQKNDGVLFAIFKQDRKWRVEVGYGLEGVLTDLEAAEIARAGVPFFKTGDFDSGVSTVSRLLARRITGEDPRPAAPPPSSSSDGDGFTLFDAVIIIFMLAVLVLVLIVMNAGDYGGGGGWSSSDSSWSSSSSSSWSSSDSGFSGGGGSSGGGGASGGW
jgi:uncharacterized protein